MWMRCQERRPRAAGCGLARVGGWGEFGVLTKLPIRERRDGRAAKHGAGEHWGAVRRELRMIGAVAAINDCKNGEDSRGSGQTQYCTSGVGQGSRCC